MFGDLPDLVRRSIGGILVAMQDLLLLRRETGFHVVDLLLKFLTSGWISLGIELAVSLHELFRAIFAEESVVLGSLDCFRLVGLDVKLLGRLLGQFLDLLLDRRVVVNLLKLRSLIVDI